MDFVNSIDVKHILHKAIKCTQPKSLEYYEEL